MKKLLLDGTISEGVGISDVQFWTPERQAAADNPFAQLGFKPDNWKAYMDFKINHSMPVVAGPTMSGNYLAYHPAVIGRSYKGLLHQQLNILHSIKQYASEKDRPKKRDRIIGAIVAVYFPPQPMGGWKIPETAEEAPSIRALAVIFKQAEGTHRIIGSHQTSREVWNNSIEVIYPTAEMGVYIPSTREVIPVIDLPADMENVILRVDEKGKPTKDKSGRLQIGKYKGEQLAFAPGCVDGTIEYQGVGMTPNPAEREAEINQILASGIVEGELMSVAASAHPLLMFKRGVLFSDAMGRRIKGIVKQVFTDGKAAVPQVPYAREATEENPVLHIVTAAGQNLLRSAQSVKAI